MVVNEIPENIKDMGEKSIENSDIINTKDKINELLDEIDIQFFKSFIEKKLGEPIYIEIDIDEGKIEIESHTKNPIATIKQGLVHKEGYEGMDHLQFEIYNKFKGKGIAKHIYDMYAYLSNFYPRTFIVPNEEISKISSTIRFYLDNEIFTHVYEISNGGEKELSYDKIENIINSTLDYSEKYYILRN